MLNLAILLFLIPPWLFLWLPYLFLRYVLLKAGIEIGKFSFTWAEMVANNIQDALNVIEGKGKRTAQFTIFWGLIMFIMLPIDPSSITGNIRPLFTLAILTIVPVGFAAWIYSKVGSGDFQETARRGRETAKEMGQRAAADPVKGQARRTGRTAKEGAQGVRDEYREINADVGEKAKGITEKVFPVFIATPLGNLIDLTPLVNMGAKEAGKRAGKKAAGKTSKMSKTTKGAKAIKFMSLGRLLLLLPFIIIFVGGILAIQFSIISGFFWAYMNIWMTMFVGPMWSAAGMGWMVAGDYAAFADQTIVDQYAPDIDLEEERMMLSEVGARADCLLSVDSVACMSEWRMNNTVQPGSDAVGQTYELETSQFIVEGGRTIDVAGRRANLPLTIRMALQNPRYGLRGVPAENISYKVGVTDRGKDGYYCDTGNHDLWEHEDRGISENSLAPGDQYQLTSVQRGKDFYQDNINLGSCGLLQPGQIEETRQAELQINYTYSSQATQTFEAMSEEHRFENEITQSFRTSETADTPVKSFVTVMSPVTYREEDDGEIYSNVIDVEVGFETDDPGVEYQIDTEELFLRPSRLTVPTGSDPEPRDIGVPEEIESIGGECDFQLANDEDGYILELNEEAQESITAQQDDAGRWWDARSSPPTFQCSFELVDPSSISSTGETLIKDVDGSYRVKQEFSSQNFDVWNTECTDRNCPLIVPEDQRQQLVEDSDDTPTQNIGEGLVSKCDRSHSAEASGGCDVRPVPMTNDGGGDVVFDESGWRVISQNYAREHSEVTTGETIEYDTIREGETAWTYGGIKDKIEDEIGSNFLVCENEAADNTVDFDNTYDHCGMDSAPGQDPLPSDWQATGFEQERIDESIEKMSEGHGVSIVRSGSGLEIESNPYHLCTNFGADVDPEEDDPEMEDVDFAATPSDFVERYTRNEYSTPVFLSFEEYSNDQCENKFEEFAQNQFDHIEAEDFSPTDITARCHPVRVTADYGWTALNAVVGVFSLGQIGGFEPPACVEGTAETIRLAGASPEDFEDEESIWVYNAETNGVMPY